MAKSPAVAGSRKRGRKPKPVQTADAGSALSNLPPAFLADVEVVVSSDDGSPTQLISSDGTTAEIATQSDGSVTVD